MRSQRRLQTPPEDFLTPADPSAGTETVPPRADAMMESLRAVGYTPGAALADLVDNSISAGAKEIRIDFHWAGADSAVVILDDGAGMDEETLRDAMRLGSRHPREERQERDLGRFGLGLKTASFSQCRLLTVATRLEHQRIQARHWDLDLLEGEDEWRLGKGIPDRARDFLETFDDMNHGTLVVWQKLDRLLQPAAGYDDAVRDAFLEHGIAVKRHLAMVFHRFLEGPNPLRILVNGKAVKPWDPFLRDHPKTQWLEKEAHEVFGKSIEVRPFVLPYHSNLTPDQYAEAGGVAGWNAMQGFYIYRAKRLIVAGGYLDLKSSSRKMLQEPHYSLARIQVDLPNSLDSEWQLDVKKATAIPPPGFRTSLEKIARITRKRAQEVVRYRGKVERREHAGESEMVWQMRRKNGRRLFMINRGHPVIRNALSVGGETTALVRKVLVVVERSMPLEDIAYQYREAPEDFVPDTERADDEEIVNQGLELYRVFLDVGLSWKEAKTRLLLIEPFGESAALIAKIDLLEREKGK